MRHTLKLLTVVFLAVTAVYLVSSHSLPSGRAEELEPPHYLPMITSPCWPTSQPVGAIAGQPPPVFCSIVNGGPDTSQAGDNFWMDSFDHGLSFADFGGTDYVLFEKTGFVHKTIHWRHAEHWMVDVAAHSPDHPSGWVRGGALLRPDKTFHFEDGQLVVEVDVAAGIEEYGTNAWPEIVVTTGAQPHDLGSLYAYDMFAEDWTLGCRLQPTRYPVCALKSDNGDLAAGRNSTRVWEMSAHQPVGQDNFGGFPSGELGDYWRLCGSGDADVLCRDRFRLVLTRTSLTLFVNGMKYFEQAGIPPLPGDLLNGDLYVYFPSLVVSHSAEALRFHWDQININPDTAPTAAPGFDIPEADVMANDALGH